MIQMLRERALWIVQLTCVLAVVSVVGGLAVAYRLQMATPPTIVGSQMLPSMRCSDAQEVFRRLSVDDPVRYASIINQACAE